LIGEKNKMKNRIVTGITVLILLIGIVSGYYPGETRNFDNPFNSENLVYAITNNITSVGDLDIQVNLTTIKIHFPEDMPPNSFDLVFMEEQTKEVVVEHYSGGGSRTKTIYKNNTIYKDRNIETIKTEYIYNDTLNDKEEEIPKRKSKWLKRIIYFAIILIKLYVLFILVRNWKGGEND